EIFLHTGRLYAKVPGHSKGFTVHTPTSSIIDLGTEFGVKVALDRSSDIHVFKGKTSLMLGTRGSTRQSQILTENHALRVKSNALKASEIALDKDMFITRLPSPYEQAVLKSKPHAHWRFEDNLSGMAMNSANKSQYNGRFFGNCSLEEVGPDLGDGESNTALVLDGQNSYVKFENIVNKRLEQYSVVLWVRPDSDEAQNIIVCSGFQGPDYDFSMQLRVGINKQFEFYTLSKIHEMVGGKGKFTIHADDTVQVDRWYFLAATIDGHNEVRLYVDGELTASTIMNDKLFNSYPDIFIGCPAGNKRNYPEHKMGAFRGTVDDIAIYNRHLDENEIKSIYKSTQKK
ncbi:MAG: FecR domain-containing protein, partial [Anaerohalosphaera sp.]|nr:FecR domain-containing protein [Anaerohalosphaera sp.]